MKNYNTTSMIALAFVGLLAFNDAALAGGNELMYQKTQALTTLSGGSIDPAADYIPVYDASAGVMKKTLATSGAGTSTTSASAELDYNDITTLGTLQASKTWTSDASLDTIMPTGGLLTVQSGGAVTMESGSTYSNAGTQALTGTMTVDGTTVNKKALTLPGRATVSICGDLTTINNNTIYYGPSSVLLTQSGQTCDTTAAGSSTEATADEPAYGAQAFQVLSMQCRSIAPGATVSFTLRSAAAATTPSMTCSETSGQTDCNTNAGTTTAIASGATVAIAAASTGDIGSTRGFRCDLSVAY